MQIHNFEPFPLIETERLIMKKMSHSDAEKIYEMRSNPKMHEHTDSKPDESIDDTIAYINKMNKGIEEGKWLIWAIEDKGTQKVIGSISIWNFNPEEGSGELGYGITPEYQGRGLMKEALLCIVEYGFRSISLNAIEAYTEENNTKSLKLLESCGFSLVNKVQDKGYYSDKTYNMLVYRLVK